MKIIVLATALLLAGCATKPPDPIIQTKEADKAVVVYCKPSMPARPTLMTRSEIWTALAAAPDSDERAKIVTSQLLAYLGWLPVVETALTGCEGPQK